MIVAPGYHSHNISVNKAPGRLAAGRVEDWVVTLQDARRNIEAWRRDHNERGALFARLSKAIRQSSQPHRALT